MYEIISKNELAPNIYLIKVAAEDIAKKSNPGQFVILRINQKGERILVFIIETQCVGEFEFRQISVWFFKTGSRQIILTTVPEKRITEEMSFF